MALRTAAVMVGLVAAGLFGPAATATAASGTAVVEIVTVPAIPGARFVFDGKKHTANKQGIVRLSVPKESRQHTLSILDEKIKTKNSEYEFARWWYHGNHENDHLKELTGLSVRRNLRIKAAFRASYLVRYSFVDPRKAPVDRKRVGRVEFRGDHGQTVSGNGSGTLRMLGVRPTVSGGTLLAKRIQYRVQRVDVDGSNVVQVNQQAFVPSQKPSVVVPLLLRSAHFSTRDLLFGGPVGKSVTLTYPDGRTAKVPLDANGKATVDNLARGQYSVRVDAPGYTFERPIVLSRNQYVDLPVVTLLDMGVVAGVAVACVGGLYLVRIRRRRYIQAADTG